MYKYFIIAFFSALLSSFSPIFLKKASNKEYKSVLKEYLNFNVIFGYLISFTCMGLTIVAFKGLPLKYAPLFDSTAYIYIMIWSSFFLKEKITIRKIAGNGLIILGILISLITFS